MKVQALFKSKAPAAKKVAKKSSSGGAGGKGWLGGSSSIDLSKYYGPDRTLYLPDGLYDRSEVPAVLDGTLPGDCGYDPLGLAKDDETIAKYRTNELLHGRWAMLAAAGIIIPEGLAANGADIKGAVWYETGAELLNGGTLNYFAVPWGIINNPLPLFVVIAIEVGLVGAVEFYRSNGTGPAGFSPGVGQFDSSVFDDVDPNYPGGPFDPLGLASDPDAFEELKVKELSNGRLAMAAVLGFAVQGYVTGEGPYANWSKHVADPFGYNLLTILGAEERTPTL